MIFNSCSHGGADTIINEVKATYPGREIRALIGGFHIYKRTEEEVRDHLNNGCLPFGEGYNRYFI